ncbi:LuxR C-terminal-related transcriptional regulator [Vibrio algicola]|uniref:Helix-turn-helix transcriptional regulator n=1 Tax=Vibrio algicola TaxID=2662262 RepID=A0A5Q0TLD6_9VIBR|nr:LuxR C-terminal-related transcriptional regulator [Vibrio algicola]
MALNSLFLVANRSLQSSLLKESLETIIDKKINMMTFCEMEIAIEKSKKDMGYVILDLEYVTDEMIHKYIIALQKNNVQTKEILINTRDEIQLPFVLTFPNVVGIFFKEVKLDHISKGITSILSGKIWLNRDLSQKIIEYYRSKDLFSSKVFASLTGREEEILKLLLIGASNVQIAEQLFVSENTVKAHLYHVFKKIKVKNRLQALMWAKNYKFNGVA